ncbi:FG-GAP repeat protein [Streptomyces jeddahensis]|uniref:FG-GAP repeat protein n=2 Tax=Streptomyces jeddahensis TaxID=1716141 RepID=A0A177HRB7_9ACTN|nr:FG-GAP repeat protein [Streptomyces jeddahensis]
MSPGKTHAYKPLSLKRRAWLTIGAVVLGGAGVVTYAVASPSAPADKDAESRKPSVRSMKLETQSTDRKGLPKKSTEQFSAVVLTWNNEKAELDGTAEVRTRSLETGEWSAWQKLPEDPGQGEGKEAERAGLRGGTESVWTGQSDGVEVRVVAEDGTASELPAGLDVKLIDPGTDSGARATTSAVEPAAFAAETATATADATATESPAPSGSESTVPAASTEPATTESATTSESPSESASASASASPEPSETVPTARPSTVVKPPIITQAEWGASTDYNGTPSYGDKIEAAVVHHTGVSSDNTLSCAESRARVRSIQMSHISQGWYDIGYNFLVDRCGQIFEGRSGGMDLPVVGAHDAGFNTNTVGISYIGNFETAKPTKAALDAISRVIAWKFGQYGVDPKANVTLTSRAPLNYSGNKVPEGSTITLPTIFGHRDTNATACPGANLYPKLSTIRTLASLPGVSHALPTSDFNRDGVSDLVAGVPKASGSVGNVVIVPGSVNGPAAGSKLRLTQSSAGVPGSSESGDQWGAATAWGDINGDGYADLAIGAPGEDDTTGHADRGAVTILYGPTFDKNASSIQLGDDYTPTGAKFGAAVTVGDFNGDGKADVFAASTGTGGSWAARFADGHEVAGQVTSGSGGLAYADATTGDFNRDGYADVALNYRDSSGIGRVTWFRGSKSTGLTKVSTLSVKGGRSIAAGDVNGNGYDDIVIGQPYTAESGAKAGGQVTMVPGTSTGFTTTGMTTIHQDTASVPGAAESGDALGWSVSVGDYNGDGYADVLAGAPNEDITRSGNRTNAGSAWLLKGTSSGLTGSGSLSFSQDTSGISGYTESNDKLGSAVSLTDLSGYGRADLTFGVEGENAYEGTLLYVPSGSSGISTSQAYYIGRDKLGTPTGAYLGQTLTP